MSSRGGAQRSLGHDVPTQFGAALAAIDCPRQLLRENPREYDKPYLAGTVVPLRGTPETHRYSPRVPLRSTRGYSKVTATRSQGRPRQPCLGACVGLRASVNYRLRLAPQSVPHAFDDYTAFGSVRLGAPACGSSPLFWPLAFLSAKRLPAFTGIEDTWARYWGITFFDHVGQRLPENPRKYRENGLEIILEGVDFRPLTFARIGGRLAGLRI